MKAFLLLCVIVQAHAFCHRCRLDNPASCGQGYACLVSNTTGKPACIAKGEWGAWSEWGLCVTPCENGTRTRTRECSNPTYKNCPGDSTEGEQCNAPYCYYFSTEELSWMDAALVCWDKNGYLAIINDADEQGWISTHFGDLNQWIGLARSDDVWIWEKTNIAPNYTAWGPGEPNDTGGCVRIVRIGNYDNKWDDVLCDDFRRYICEFDLL